MGPLLIWAIRFVEDLADDILTAHAEARRLHQAAHSQQSTPAGRLALNAYLTQRVAGGAPLPATVQNGKPALPRAYVAAMTGASLRQVAHASTKLNLAALVTANPCLCPLDVPVTGRINGRPWREVIDYTEAETLLKHLVTAAFIVCSYLTGARPQEVLGLRAGCCPDPEPGPDGQSDRHVLRVRPEDVAPGLDEEDAEDAEEPHLLIRGHHYKTATDPDTGHYLPGGAERAVPWVAITPVVNAIRVLECFVPDGELLFAAAIHDPTHARHRTGSLGNYAIAVRLEDFVTWVNNEAEALGLPGEVIAPDPHGRIGTARFRRTLIRTTSPSWPAVSSHSTPPRAPRPPWSPRPGLPTATGQVNSPTPWTSWGRAGPECWDSPTPASPTPHPADPGSATPRWRRWRG